MNTHDLSYFFCGGALLIFGKRNVTSPKHLSSFPHNITLTSASLCTLPNLKPSKKKLQFDASMHAVNFCAFHQLLHDMFLCTGYCLHQEYRF